MFYMHDIGWGWWLVMSLGMVAFWALVIYGIVWMMRARQNPQQRDEPSPEPSREILKRRLANGEISIEEYRQLLEALDGQPPRHSMAA